MNLFSKHRSWWGTLISTFIGSLLGIGITFAISGYIQAQHQERMSKRLLLMAVKDMYRTNSSIYNNSLELFRTDSIFWAMRTYHKQQKRMPKDSIRLFFKTFKNHSIVSKEPSFISNILKTNVEILDVLEDLSVINDITKIYELLNMQKQAHEEMIQIKQAIYDYNMDRRIPQAADLYERFDAYEFELGKMPDYLIIFHLNAMGIKQLNQTNKDLIEQLQRSLQLSDDDLEQLSSDRLHAKPIKQQQQKKDLKYKQSIQI